jgi:Beta-glucosidase/6-phospho-beta-glucosidase/beta-galactosidase
MLFFYYFAGKGVSIWDTYVHKHPNRIAGGSNGDVAADSYYQYMQDVAALKKLGVSTISFHFSSVILRMFMGADICIQSQYLLTKFLKCNMNNMPF